MSADALPGEVGRPGISGKTQAGCQPDAAIERDRCVNVLTMTPAAATEPADPGDRGGAGGVDERLEALFDSTYAAMVRLAYLLSKYRD